jgi:uncharacterized damage-inducible protein DinB
MAGDTSMNLEMIRAIQRYNYWATEHMLTCSDQISTEEFVRDDDTPWGSIRNQLVHQFIVHRRWLSWMDGSLSGEEAYALRVDPADYPDLASVREMWESLREQDERFLQSLDESTLKRALNVEMPGSEFSIPVWQVMLHVAHHSMQHRTESAMSLTRLGASPGDIDYLFFALTRD